ncbi:YhdB family protein [Caldibacillus debilis]|uniref:YhdB family protein n=1 Tax=Caldibacillus debilis TaxID=301148 RepID=UPI000E38210F|nr:YhdB family protein [Caldibacillus debilis]REJ22591.1 MAG: hypothetical protein C6W56_15970 [Caldibacillus debilis]
MNKADYDRALHYAKLAQWDHLLILMVRTKDDILSKKIKQFLHAYHFQYDYTRMEYCFYELLRYAEYANEKAAGEQNEAIFV